MAKPVFIHGRARLYETNCFDWLKTRRRNSVHGVVTDPPYGIVEYSSQELEKLRAQKGGGIWRVPPSFDGNVRAPLPRFTTLSQQELQELEKFFETWAILLKPVLVPGAHVLIASNPLLAHRITRSVEQAGFEYRGNVIRLLQTMRGGDRPKHAHKEFSGVSVMPRSQYEPWILVRKPCEGRVQDNLRKWKTGGLRRISDTQPFGDVIRSAPMRKKERELSPHPSLKPQAFMRQVVRAILPLGQGVVLDTFAGGGSTLAAAEVVGYRSIGLERDHEYVTLAQKGIPKLAAYKIENF